MASYALQRLIGWRTQSRLGQFVISKKLVHFQFEPIHECQYLQAQRKPSIFQFTVLLSNLNGKEVEIQKKVQLQEM